MIWFFALVIVVLIGLAVVIASGRWGGLPTVDHDRPDTVVPTGRLLTGEDIAASRFAVSIRGYRIDEVDTLLDRLAAEVDRRDRKIEVLTGRAHARDEGQVPEAPGGAVTTDDAEDSVRAPDDAFSRDSDPRPLATPAAAEEPGTVPDAKPEGGSAVQPAADAGVESRSSS